MNPRVVDAKAIDNLKLEVIFSNGEKGIFDVKPYLKDKFWSKLQNIDIFKSVKVTGGSVSWLNEDIDFCPDEVYENTTISD